MHREVLINFFLSLALAAATGLIVGYILFCDLPELPQ